MALSLRAFVTILLVSVACSNLSADTLYVKKGVSGGDGKSWATAYSALSRALYAWVLGDEIWVAHGTYLVKTANTDAFEVRNGFRIYGGFKGTEKLREHRDWYRFKTILTADIMGNDAGATSLTDPRRVDNLPWLFYTSSDGRIDSSTILDGLNFTGVNGNGNGGGHAIDLYQGSPVFRNCHFYGNASLEDGAAVRIQEAQRPRFEYCVFSNNTAVNGGAVSITGPIADTVRGPIFAQCVWEDNTASGDGGAIELGQEGARADINSCVFYRNIAAGGGGAIYGSPFAKLHMYNSTFSRNEASLNRGWMLEVYGASIVNSSFWHGAETIGALIMRPVNTEDTAKIDALSCLVQNDAVYGFYQLDPEFVDVENPAGADGFWGTDDDGLRVQHNSICFDKGLVNSYTNFTRVDAMGNPRVVGNKIDIGAYEWQRDGHDDYVAHMTELRTGKLVQLYRHGITDWGQKDPGPAPECYPNGIGRNLSEDGRDQTKSVGKYMIALNVPIEDSFTSPVCRCWESALYQAGRYDKKSHWGSGGGAASDSLRHIDLSSIPVNGCRMINTHDAVIVPTIDASSAEIEEGDAAILRPDGENFTWISHFTSDNWERYRVRFPDASVGVDFESPADRALQAPLNNLLYSAHSIVVYNVLGATLLALTDEAHALRSAIDGLPSGWYAVVVTDVDGTTRAVTVVR